MRYKKIWILLFVIFAAFMITQEPQTAADWVKKGFTIIRNAFEGLFTFFEALA